MSRLLALLGAALWLGALAGSAPLALALCGLLAVGSLWFQWRGRAIEAVLLLALAGAATALTTPGSLALAAAGLLLQALGTVQSAGPRSLSLGSWMLATGMLGAILAATFWVPLRGSLFGAGSTLPLVMALAGIGLMASVLVLRDDEPPAGAAP